MLELRDYTEQAHREIYQLFAEEGYGVVSHLVMLRPSSVKEAKSRFNCIPL